MLGNWPWAAQRGADGQVPHFQKEEGDMHIQAHQWIGRLETNK